MVHLYLIYLLKIAIFHNYVSLPEGRFSVQPIQWIVGWVATLSQGTPRGEASATLPVRRFRDTRTPNPMRCAEESEKVTWVDENGG